MGRVPRPTGNLLVSMVYPKVPKAAAPSPVEFLPSLTCQILQRKKEEGAVQCLQATHRPLVCLPPILRLLQELLLASLHRLPYSPQTPCPQALNATPLSQDPLSNYHEGQV